MNKQEVKDFQDGLVENLQFKEVQKGVFQKVYTKIDEDTKQKSYLGLRLTFTKKALRYYQISSIGELLLQYTCKLEDLKVDNGTIDIRALKPFRGRRKRAFIKFND